MPTKSTKKTKSPKLSPFKKGSTATMLFHGFGLTSEEIYKILAIEKDGTVVLNTDEDPSKCFRFDSKNGRCLNDSTFMDCSRTLKLT